MAPWWVPSNHRLASEATRWTAGRSSPGSSPRARAARWLRGSWVYPSLSSPRYPAQPSVTTLAPGATWSVTKACRQAADASATGAIRHRPNPRGSLTSTAIAVRTFLPLARPPRSPGSCPPMKVSSTSTVPDSCSRSGRTRTARSRCSIAQAVWYEPISRVRCRLRAETPSLLVANSQQALNHTVSGVLVRSNTVPAVTEVRPPHPSHMNRPSPRRQPPPGHSPDTRNPQASAATPANLYSRHRSGTRLGPRPSTSGTARQHEEHPPGQATPVKWIGQSEDTGSILSLIH